MKKSDSDTVTFFGKTYPVRDYEGPWAKVPFGLDCDRTGNWCALTDGPLDDITIAATGKTAQQATKGLERELLKEFKKLAKVCSYEVQG